MIFERARMLTESSLLRPAYSSKSLISSSNSVSLVSLISSDGDLDAVPVVEVLVKTGSVEPFWSISSPCAWRDAICTNACLLLASMYVLMSLRERKSPCRRPRPAAYCHAIRKDTPIIRKNDQITLRSDVYAAAVLDRKGKRLRE